MRYALMRILVGVVIGLVLMFAHQLARAYPAVPGTMFRYVAFTGCPAPANPESAASGYVYADENAACAASVAIQGETRAYKGAFGSCASAPTSNWYSVLTSVVPDTPAISAGSCTGEWHRADTTLYAAGSGVGGWEHSTVNTCPNGGTLSGSTCTCGVGYTDSGTACVAAPVSCEWPKYDNGAGACACSGVNTGYGGAGGADIIGDSTFGSSGVPISYTCPAGSVGTRPSSQCVGGCTVNLTYPGMTVASRSGTTCSGEVPLQDVRHTGTTCTGGVATPDTNNGEPPVPCPHGQVRGTVNGVERCLPGNTTGTNGPPAETTTTTTAPDGTVTEREISEERVTNCSGPGACSTTVTTTTTTTVTPSGGSPSTTTETTTATEPGDGTELGGFCQENPNSPICKSSAWGGACSAFTCDGDAIQCAIAREIHQNNCNLYSGHSGGVTTADAGATFTSLSDGLLTGTGRMGTQEIDASTAFALTERGVGLSSLSDWTVHGITIPLSQMNTPLSYLGYIVLIFCTLWGAQIMFAGRPA
jgi:hypothetical protein